MSIRTSLLALPSIAALAIVAVAPTEAFACHAFMFAKHSGGGGHRPPCGRVGCNMEQ